MLMHAVLNVVLSRYGSNNIAIGTAVANRVRPEVEGLIGFFVNTLVLFTKVNPLHSVSDLLAQVKQVNEGAQQHQDFPFEKLFNYFITSIDYKLFFYFNHFVYKLIRIKFFSFFDIFKNVKIYRYKLIINIIFFFRKLPFN